MDTRITYLVIGIVTALVNIGFAYAGVTNTVSCTVGQMAAAIQGTALAAETTKIN